MNDYFYTYIDRRDFGDILSKAGISRLRIQSKPGRLEYPCNNALLAVWLTDPLKTGKLPEFLICQNEAQDDWAAWLTTYAAKIRPFSAYIRLLAYSEFQMIINNLRDTELDLLAWPVAGLILGEVLAASSLPDKSLETLPATAFESTLSFVMFRTAILYKNFNDWDGLIQKWDHIRKVTKQRDRSIDSSSIAYVCLIILKALGIEGNFGSLNRNDKEVIEACRILLNSPQRLPSLIFLNSFDIKPIIHGSREDRVIAFENFLKDIKNFTNSISSELTAFIIGFLASRIAPGTIKHSSILTQIFNQYPTTLLWYGFCAGFTDSEDFITSFGSIKSPDFPPIGRRIIRELFRQISILEASACDIGYLELIALSKTLEMPLEGIIRAAQGTAIIELMPGVCTSVNVFLKQQEKIQSRDLREKEIASIGKQIEYLRETYKKLLNESTGSMDEQQSLFQSSTRKKNKKTTK